MINSKRLYLITGLSLGLMLFSCKKDDSVLSGERPSLTVSAVVIGGSVLSPGGQVTATDTVDFLIDVNAPVGFNSVLVGGSGNAIISAGAAAGAMVAEDIPYRVLTTTRDEGASAAFIFVAVDDIGQQSDTASFSFTIVP